MPRGFRDRRLKVKLVEAVGLSDLSALPKSNNVPYQGSVEKSAILIEVLVLVVLRMYYF